MYFGNNLHVSSLPVVLENNNNNNKCNNNNNNCEQSNVWKLIADFLKEILFSGVEYVVA